MNYEALRVPLDYDLRPLAMMLAGRGVPHQISELQGEQVVWVTDETTAQAVQSLHQRMASGEIELTVEPSEAPVRQPSRATTFLPVTLLLLVLSILGAALVTFSTEGMALLTYYQINAVEDGYVLSSAPDQYWRWFTPVFLHYGLMHLVFNGLWTWELGRRIEFKQGSMTLLIFTVVSGVFSNLAQVWYTPGQLFGGMSGVIYAYLGYIVVWQRFRPTPAFSLPKGIVVFMLAWLFICMAGFTEMLGLGSIANAAHLGGLIAGVVLALSGLAVQRLTGR
ncbi:GlpG protein [Litorivivens lipolytica]|uniref:GlpG protein n=1 Tax=Litorivivens lipolytica TaxID=1524264 RepID=A0A7W4W2E6_9GAMM|nr:rhomboid family intramembrane serine protease [Litorivivens lipolytica]MBB3045883.1 GlpG protein [Litorivivens lipolytica]